MPESIDVRAHVLLVTLPALMSVLFAGCAPDDDATGQDDTALLGASADQSLCDAINAYRVDRGLPAIPSAPALMAVARAHVEDLNRDQRDQGCNLHSWTDDPRWSGCCYTPDHARASCMWDKPAEIAGYDGPGFEVAVGSNRIMDATTAVGLWHDSDHHRVVIANEANWANKTWRGLGCAIQDGYAVAWVGELADAP